MKVLFKVGSSVATMAIGTYAVTKSLDLKVDEIAERKFKELKVSANRNFRDFTSGNSQASRMIRGLLIEQRKNQLMFGPAAIEFDQPFFGKYEKIPTFRGDKEGKETVGFYPVPFSTHPWHQGLLFQQAYVNDSSITGLENDIPGSTGGVVSQSLSSEIAEGFAKFQCVYVIAAQKHNSFSTAVLIEDGTDSFDEKEIVSTDIDPSQFIAILKPGNPENFAKDGPDKGRTHYVGFERGHSSIHDIPRTVETESILDFALTSPIMPESDKIEIRKLKEEWKSYSPDKPINATKLFDNQMARNHEELSKRRTERMKKIFDL
ncbi:hypothetical protein [Candidatus Neptunichlamydia sp. REUL1]|uniref:hypothetical protein n=1 Tax=Candidatus Neptunichlamydia sp. REUL1 TaxID=3064277 RepID=UPI00292F224D|nr:hypothetical protein [Candidatus Neptunochlamydia sp. REUL1]